ncbi:MAG: hypothetical protein KDG50_15980 [Chromatiales bacterium]|nr:hypothetical protein [Chromatiales bacterium]
MQSLAEPIVVEKSELVARVLDEVGRTEDLDFSPDNRRVAIVGYMTNTIALVDLDIRFTTEGARIVARDAFRFRSGTIRHPHGVAFIDDDHLIVANRRGEAPVFRLPPSGSVAGEIALEPVRLLRGNWWRTLRKPGSVCVNRLDDCLVEALICEAWEHTVSRFVIDTRANFALRKSSVLLERDLDLPDGVATDAGNRWIAVTNHLENRTVIFRRDGRLTRRTPPCGSLRGGAYPHGVRFTPDGRIVLVSSAGAPRVDVFRSDDGDWCGAREPVASIRVMDERTFERGQINPQEGGPKGLAIDRTGRLFAVTSDRQRLAFFDLQAAVSGAA